MSALAGVWHRDGSPGACGRVQFMLKAQRIYGPDDVRLWSGDDSALGRNLMRTLPEDVFDTQPVPLANGRMHLVADVRLDNRDELRDALEIGYPEAAAMSDAALLARAWDRWQEDCLDRLFGDFAFAVWNASEETWFLARDAMGARPLFYFATEACFAFASMPSGLLALSEVPCQPNWELLYQFIEFMPRGEPAERNAMSCYRDIHSLPAGFCARVSRREINVRRYWKPSPSPLFFRGPENYYEALREHLDSAVLSRLRGVSTVASQLSGGLDSSSVTATAARLQRERGQNVVAYTSVPQIPVAMEQHARFADETKHASATAALYPNVEHVLVTTKGRSPICNLDRNFDLYQQPVMALSNLAWLEAINDEVAGRELQVLLTGAAGNRTISYTGVEMLPEMLRFGPRGELLRTLGQLHRQRGMSWKSLIFRTLSPWMPQPVRLAAFTAQRRTAPQDAVRDSLLNPRLREERLRIPHPGAGDQISSICTRIGALHEVDSASLRKGVLAQWRIRELDPTSDRRLAEFCFSVPAQEYLRDGTPSSFVRNGMSDRLPEMVRHEYRKGLQGTDWHVEMTRDHAALIHEIAALEASPAASALLDIAQMKKMAEEWPTSGWEHPFVRRMYGIGLLNAVSAGHFVRRVEALERDRQYHKPDLAEYSLSPADS